MSSTHSGHFRLPKFSLQSRRDVDMTEGNIARHIISFAFPSAAISIALGSSFQALGTGIYSTITSACRQLLVLLPAAYLLSLSGDVTMVWWAYPIAEVVGLTLTLLLFSRNYRYKIKPMM